MKKDVQEAIQFAMNNTLLLSDKVNELSDKVNQLDDHLAFYAATINQLEMTVKELSHNFHSTQAIDPYIVNVSNSEALEKALEELTPKRVTNGLKKLYNKTNKTFMDDVNETVDKIILEKKIREAIIEKLELEAEDNRCDCGDTCIAFDNGFAEAIYFIRNM
jgi:predicted RNase H-like nuclease (RuvC/YqgF family)